jgi:hypothetical protein
VKKGIVYFSHYSCFFSSQDDPIKRFDNSEGASYHYQPEDVKYITIANYNFKLAGPFTPHFKPPAFPYVYCLHATTEESLLHSINNQVYDPRLWEDFGEYLVLIHNTNEFKNRIASILIKQKVPLNYDLIEYIDTAKYSGELGIFRKKNNYNYQNEFRIAICPNTENLFYKIEIGDISDIAHGPVHKSKCKNL